MEWEQAEWRGKTPAVRAEGFHQAQLPALNKRICDTYHDRLRKQVLKGNRASHRQMRKTLQGISEAELFTPGQYRWTRKDPFAVDFISANSSHDLWAREEARKCLKK